MSDLLACLPAAAYIRNALYIRVTVR